LVAEVVANAFVAFVRLLERGLVDIVYQPKPVSPRIVQSLPEPSGSGNKGGSSNDAEHWQSHRSDFLQLVCETKVRDTARMAKFSDGVPRNLIVTIQLICLLEVCNRPQIHLLRIAVYGDFPICTRTGIIGMSIVRHERQQFVDVDDRFLRAM
jgi:hypothetical protein